MLTYWALVLVAIFLALGEPRDRGRSEYSIFQIGVLLLLFVVMGSRETCGDYRTYLIMFKLIEHDTLAEALVRTDPLYGLINWVSGQLRLGIYGVNTACAAVFLWCIHRFSRDEPMPMFFTALSIPYFVIVVGMGYTRQGVAAALILFGLRALQLRSPMKFVTAIVLASGFHSSAYAMLPAILFGELNYRNKSTKFLIRAVVLGVGMYGFYRIGRERVDYFYQQYVVSDRYESGGALLRSLVTGAAGVVFFTKRREWKEKYDDYSSLIYFALLALAVVPGSLVASTPADRLGLYLIPFQLIVFSRLPTLYPSLGAHSQMKMGISAAYIAYFFVWLHLGNFAKDLWVPYKSALW